MSSSSQSAGLFTIGYEGKTVETYFAQLRQAGISLLCDVRGNPISRKPGFSKRRLASACVEAGLRYEHLPELGIPSAERKNLRTPADRASLFARYTRETLPRERAAVMTICGWIIDDHHRVALTCFEADPAECHRHCVADALVKEGIMLPVHL